MKLQKVVNPELWKLTLWTLWTKFWFLFTVLWFAGFTTTVGYCCHKNVPSTSIDLPRSMLKFYDHHSHWNVSYAGIFALNCFPLHTVQYLVFSFLKYACKFYIFEIMNFILLVLITLFIFISVQELGLQTESF